MNPSTNATLNDVSFLVPPTRFLFQPAHRPKLPLHIGTLASPGRQGLLELAQRDLTCASDETACSQGSWCCGNGSTCSLDNGAFFCCAAPGAAAGQDGGCARVCAAGDFQCGNVCCADGQTCMGAESGSPYCLNPSTTSSLILTTSSISLPTTTSTVAHTSSKSTMTLSTTSPTASIPTATAIAGIPSLSASSTTSETTKPISSSMTSSPSQSAADAPTSTSSESGEGGIPMAAQVSIGVIVPIVCIILVFGLWMVLFRRSKSRRLTMTFGRNDDVPPGFYVVGPSENRPSSYYPTTPPPAYTKSATTLVSTMPAASSTATSVYGGSESLSSRDQQQGGMEMSTLSPSPVLPPLDQRLSVMDVRLPVASTTVEILEHASNQGQSAAAVAGSGPDDVHPGTPVDISRSTVYYPRNSVVGRDSMGVYPGTAL